MAIGTVYRISVKTVGSLTEDVPYAWNSRHYVVHSGSGTDSAADLITAVRPMIEPSICGCLARKARVLRWEASLATTPKAITATEDVDEVGTGSRVNYLPSFLAGLIRLHWEPSADNRRCGKWFTAFIPIPVTDTQGGHYTIRLSELADWLVADTFTSPAGLVYRPVVWHAKTATWDRVLSSTASGRYHCYRSRGKTAADTTMIYGRGLCGLT